MGKTIGWTMAKASEEDIAGGFDLAAILDAIDKGDYPSYFATPADRDAAEESGSLPGYFDADNVDHLRHLHTLLIELLRRRPGFSLLRMVMGMHVILHNDLLDPDVDHLAIHPKFAAESKLLRDALVELVGSGDVDHLRRMEALMVATALASADKTAALNAIHVLIATATDAEVSHG